MQWFGRYIGKMAGGNTLPPAPRMSSAILAGIGATFAIAATAGLGEGTGALLLMAPFGASCFLAFAVPESPLAQPRNIVLGHLISTAIGLIVLALLGGGWPSMALAVGLAVIMMQVTRTGHPPAGADPLVVFALQPAWSFLIFPVLTGAVLIAMVALIFNNLRSDVRYPEYW